jgi:hypothetical protein
MEQQAEPQSKFKKGCMGCLRLALYLSAAFVLIILAFIHPSIFTPLLVALVLLGIILLVKQRKMALMVISIIIIAGSLITLLMMAALKIVQNTPRYTNNVRDEETGEYEFFDPSCETDHLKEDVWTYTMQNDIALDSQMVKQDEIVRHSRSWKDYNGNRYRGKFLIAESAYKKAKHKRRGIYLDDGSWGEVYLEMINNDHLYLKQIIQMYDSIGKAKKLDRIEFAEMVVGSVQSIPYVYISAYSCQDDDVKEKTEEIGCPCLGYIKYYGVQSPVEFMYNQMGDCDTRSVFLYLVLSYFDYDVAVLVSEHYGHAVLGIDIPARGDYLARAGTKYYVWETTAEGYAAGEMPPDMDNMNFWYFALY